MAYEFHNLLVSSLAALLTRLITHPLDTLKTRLQVSGKNQGIFYTLRKILATESVWALYKGLGIALAFNAPALTMFLSVYDWTKHFLEIHFNLSSLSLFNHLISGCMAEIVSGMFWTPMEIIKSKLQVSGMHPAIPDVIQEEDTVGLTTLEPESYSSHGYSDINTLSVIRNIFEVEGPLGFFKGYWLSLLVFIPNSMIYFAFYEYFKGLILGHVSTAASPNSAPSTLLTGLIYATSAILSCTLAAGTSNLPDVIKTRWQVLSQHERDRFGGPTKMAIHMWETEGGLLAFTQGMGARIAFMAPSTVISMTIYDLLKWP
ncbi:mitochondrial carrier [Basidiobolus meristosporus CBS 931.73]|uniref:Mitochondrial carrier n=1 Tax=Basidiobolus meristosporus CBS 931.73 TaxID=1314790 RepID=A0A1Y1XYH0_9FUNG|nr:mitochondrial carrier [Basidiobolus meristosporus CBS 931.73]|eukprot:ORX90404.1 mitochondrial carrier [Basidiobolus meristosporus CBS 931.73]